MPSKLEHEANRQLLTDEQRLAWLRLIRSQNVGPVTFHELLDHFGDAETALNALPNLSAAGKIRKNLSIFSRQQAEREIVAAQKIDARLVALGEPDYPPYLAKIHAPPPLIYMKGETDIANKPSIAIVGSRNGSAAGKKITKALASGLGASGYAITSGLARGIDGEAHSASLDTGTIAVLAGGLDHPYPPEHKHLQQKIGEIGLLVSECPPGFVPRAQDFPRRNRIISGISLGVIIIEAAEKSGSLITARCALDQNREVFAVPGNPLDPRAAGTNKLIKQGATLVTCANDVASVIAPMSANTEAQLPLGFNGPEADKPAYNDTPRNLSAKHRERVIQALGPSPVDIDELIRATEMSPREVRTILLELELSGRLERHGRQLVSLVS